MATAKSRSTRGGQQRAPLLKRSAPGAAVETQSVDHTTIEGWQFGGLNSTIRTATFNSPRICSLPPEEKESNRSHCVSSIKALRSETKEPRSYSYQPTTRDKHVMMATEYIPDLFLRLGDFLQDLINKPDPALLPRLRLELDRARPFLLHLFDKRPRSPKEAEQI
ncbi:hypothetical protein H4Q26_017249 [Puccinia striiformis f. sp. tritici PST-130]|nr:hypothetical protein H4Q26_017249 [Puccinia striiformis f. sp. tritici PST-130]